ncbi:cupin domain-containing protein [candidate division KSB1 bacterium]|nr:cupin domain-containing protein [candidate division KSB1 bacterium]
MLKLNFPFAIFILLCLSFLSHGQESSLAVPSQINRNVLHRSDIPGTNLEVVLADTEISKDTPVETHIHHNIVMVYVVEGEYWVQLKDQPRKILRTGESITVPGNTVHQDGANSQNVKLTAVYIVEKGQPLASPVK